MWLEFFLVLVGFALLVYGGDVLVDNASDIARYFGLSELVIGLTIVAFGTSAPELMVSLSASFRGLNDFIFGNIFGSNVLNIFLGLGIAGIFLPLKVKKSTVKFEIPFLVSITLICTLLLNDQFFDHHENILSLRDGLILLILFLVFMIYTYRLTKFEDDVEHEEKPDNIIKPIGMFLVGCVFLKFGSDFVVENAEIIGKAFNVSDAIMGLTVLALGTSLPELVVSISAVKKGKTDIAIGGMVGSNIFNILLVLGISAIVSPIPYSINLNQDLLVVNLAGMLLLAFIFFGRSQLLSRRSSISFLLIYVLYAGYRFI